MSTMLMRIRTLVGGVSLAALVAATASCGDVVTSNDSPVLLLVTAVTPNPLASDVVDDDGIVFNDVGSASVTVLMKDVTLTPTANNRVTINRYHVSYRRADGRNVPGVDVPYGFDGVTTLTIQAGATGTVSFEVVRHIAKIESPLVELNFNLNVINVITDVTFFGQDLVGNDVSATGSMLIDFGDF